MTYLETIADLFAKRKKCIDKLIYRKLFPLPDPDRQSRAIDQIKRAIHWRSYELQALTSLHWKFDNDSRSTPGNSNKEGDAR